MKPVQPFSRPASHALALEARMLFDAAMVATATAIDQAATAAAVNQPPTVTADASGASHDVQASGAVAVFAHAAVSTGEADQRFTDLVLTIDSTDAREALVIDGTDVALQARTGAPPTANAEYAYTVTTANGRTTIAISIEASNQSSAADIQALIDGIRYKTLDSNVAGGNRTITLTSIRDDGGTDGGGQDTTVLAVSSTITVVNDVNYAPVLANSTLPDLAQTVVVGGLAGTEVAYARDGKHAYAAGADGTLVTFEVDALGRLTTEQVLTGVTDLGAISDLVLSADGKSVYAAAGGNIVRLDIGADGKLAYGATFSGGGQVINLAIAEDGTQVYASTQYGGLTVFNRDAATGDLASGQRFDEGAVGGGRTRTIFTSGDHVFVASGSNLVTFERNGDGVLAKVELAVAATGIPTSVLPSLAATADGGLVFVSDGNTIRAYQLTDQGAGKVLVAAGSTTLAGVSGLTVAADGKHLYATSSAGTLTVYGIGADGGLTVATTLANVAGARAVTVAPDGATVLVAGNEVTRFTLVQTVINGAERPVTGGLTMSDANLDALADGNGNYQGASIVIARDGGAAGDDRYGFQAGSGLTLVDGKIMQDGQHVATFTVAGGVLTVAFTAATGTADANRVLQQITYSNDGSHANGTQVTLAVTVNDGVLTSAIGKLNLVLTDNTPPTLATTPVVNPVYVTAGTQVPLFATTVVNTGEPGQLISELKLGIGGVATAASEFLIVDGTRISLAEDSNGVTANGIRYAYARSGDNAGLVLSADGGMATATVQGLVNGMRYVNDSGAAVTGVRTIAVTGLSDNGGGADSAVLAIGSTVTLAVNNAPVVDSDSAPVATLFYSDGKLAGYNDYVSSLTVSADGATLYITGSTGSNNTGVTYLRVYSRDATSGALNLLQTFTQGISDDSTTTAIEVNGLNGLSTLSASSDGHHVYAAGFTSTGTSTTYSLVLFTRNADGTLTYRGPVATQGATSGGMAIAGLDAAVTEIVFSADGNSVYTINGVTPGDVATGKSVIASYRRDAVTGALTFTGSYTGGSADLNMNQPTGLVLSGDGRSAYVSNNASGMITVFTRNTETGVLSYATKVTLASIQADPNSAALGSETRFLTNLHDIALSPDDKYVYVSSNNIATIAIFERLANGNLRYHGMLDAYPFANSTTLRDMTMSADGTALYVTTYGGRALLVFGRDAATGALTFVEAIRTASTNQQHLAVSADGRSMYIGSTLITTGVEILAPRLTGTFSTVHPIPFATGIDFHDVDFDAAGDYRSTLITIAGATTVSASDRFGFQDANGLTLVDGKILHEGVAIADFTAGAGTVAVRFIASVDGATANRVLHQITYGNDASTATGVIKLAVTVSDGAKSVTEIIALQANRAPTLDLPAYVPPKGSANAAYSATLPEELFKDFEGDALTWDVTGLPPGLVFDADTRTISGTVTERGKHVIGIEVTDSAGNVATWNTTLTIAVDAIYAPAIGGDATNLEYGGKTDGYASDIYQEVLDGVRDTVASADGKYLYVTNVNAEGTATLSVYSRTADGRLDHVQSLQSTNIPGLAGSARVLLSGDGATVYVIGTQDNSLQAFTRDAATGILTAAGVLSGATLGGAITEVVSRDNLLYVTAGDTLTVLRQDDAALAVAFSYHDGQNGITGLAGASRLVLGADGTFLYVASDSNGNSTLATVFAVGADGALTRTGSMERAGTENYVRALTVAPDGQTLYAINNGEPATVEALAIGVDGSLSSLAQYELGASGSELVVSNDGRVVYVVGEGQVAVYTRAADGTLARSGVMTNTAATPDDWGQRFESLASATLSADGKQLYLTGLLDGRSALMTIALTPPATAYTEGADAVLILPSAHIASPTIDGGNGNYQGAVLTIARTDGAVTDDHYGLLAGNGYTLADGVISRDGIAIATLVEANGVATITFTASMTRDGAQQVLRQVTYSNSSNDPTHSLGAWAEKSLLTSLRITLSDGSDLDATTDVELVLTGVNQAPTLESTVLNPTLPQNGEFVHLFQDTRIDTIEADQEIWKVILKIDASGPDEVLRYDGGTVRLVESNGVMTTALGKQYQVIVENGQATVTLYFRNSATAVATSIDSLTYNNYAADASGTRTVTLTIQESQYSDSTPDTTLAAQAVITLAPASEPNTAPVLQAGASVPGYIERGDAITPAANVTVADAQMDQLNSGKGNYAGATLTVTLGAGADRLDSLGFKAGNGLTLVGDQLQKNGAVIGTVTAEAGKLQIVFADDAGATPTTADVQNALRQVTYASTDHAPGASVAVEITLGDRYLASTTLSLDIAIMAVNDAPVLRPDPVVAAGTLDVRDNLTAIAGLETVTASAASIDGGWLYVADNHGAIAVFSRDSTGALTYRATLAAGNGLGAIEQLLVSHDGKSLYAIGAAAEGGHGLAQYTLAADGAMQFTSLQLSGADNDYMIYGATAMVEAADGRAVYFLSGASLVNFNRDPATGQLTYREQVGSSSSEPYVWSPATVTVAGDVVFVTSTYDKQSVAAYRRDVSGALVAMGYVLGSDIGVTGIGHATASADGSSLNLYLASGDTIHLLHFNVETNAFSYAGAVATNLSAISDLALAADGRSLFATSADGKLLRFAVDGDQLLPMATLDTGTAPALAGASQIVTTADGDVIVVGAGLAVLDQHAPAKPVYAIGGGAVPLAPTLQLSDAELDAAAGGSGNYQGASISVGRSTGASTGDQFGFAAGNDLRLDNGQIVKNGNVIASFSQHNGVLTVAFTGAATSLEARSVLHQLTYAPAGQEPGTVALTLTFSDGAAQSTQSLAIDLVKVNQAPVAAGGDYALATGKAGSAYNTVLPATLFTDADNDALTWQVIGLPAGLQFDAATRTISGTPAAAGAVDVTIKVNDPSGAEATRTIRLQVAAADPVTPVDPTTPTTPVDPTTPTTPTTPVDPTTPTTPVDPTTPTTPVDPTTPTTPVDPTTPTTPVDPTTPTTPVDPTTPTTPVDPTTPTTPVDPTTPTTPVDPTTPTTPVDPTTPTTPVDPGTPTTPVTPPVVTPVVLPATSNWNDRGESVTEAEAATRAAAATAVTGFAPRVVQAPDTTPAAAPGAMPVASAAATQHLLDTLRTRQLAEQRDDLQATRLADGRDTALVALAAVDGPALGRSVERLSGAWRVDAAGNRLVYALPAGLFTSRTPLAALTLQMRDRTPLPAGVRLDVERGLVIASGVQTGVRALALDLVARDANGDTVTIALTVGGRDSQPAPQEPGRETIPSTSPAADAGKPPLTLQLRQHAARDLFAQAQQLLDAIAQPAASPDAVSPSPSSDALAATAGVTTTIES